MKFEGNIGAVKAVRILIWAEEALLYFRGQASVFPAVLEAVEAVVLVLEVLAEAKTTSICAIRSRRFALC